VKVVLFANTDWYLFNFRLPLARALRDAGDDVVLASPPGPYVDRLRAGGWRHVAVDFSRGGMNPLAELATVWKLARLYVRERPGLVHHFTIKCVIYGGLAARAAGIRAVVSSVTGMGHVFVTDSARTRLLRPLVRGLYRLVLPRSEVIFENRDDRAEFGRMGLVDPARGHLVRGTGVDLERFSPAAGEPHPPTAIMMGRLLREKGVREFVEAAAIARRALPGARFRIAGAADPGNPSSIAAAQIEAWRDRGDVDLLGHRDDVVELLHQSDIAVLPSHREGTPQSLLEAAACGLPLVATDVPGCREVVADGSNGRLVPPGDVEALAAAMVELLGDRELRARMGTSSREIAVAQFGVARIVAETRRVHAAALAAAGGEMPAG
jgi:glycosyltransferase involved in cell wall biosynthesis